MLERLNDAVTFRDVLWELPVTHVYYSGRLQQVVWKHCFVLPSPKCPKYVSNNQNFARLLEMVRLSYVPDSKYIASKIVMSAGVVTAITLKVFSYALVVFIRPE